MAGDKLRQPLRIFPRHRVSGMGHDADRDPLCLERGRYPHKGSDHSPTISIFLAAQLA